MGQTNAQRVSVTRRENITTPANDDKQPLADTSWLKVGDTVDFVDIDAAGCIVSILGTRTITAICPDDAIVVDSVIDTTAATGTAAVENQTLHNAQAAFDRLCQDTDFKNRSAEFTSTIASGTVDGANNDLIMDSLTEDYCFAAGDTVDVICDSGAPIIGATIVSVTPSTNEIVIDDNTDISSETNCKLVNTSLTTEIFYMRLKSAIVNINGENDDEDDHGEGDCTTTVFYTNQLFSVNTTKLHLDGRRLKRGTCGTRASLVNDVTDAELTLTSLVLGTDGNNVAFEMTDPGGTNPLTVTVSGNFGDNDQKVTVQLETVAASIVSTAQQVADAINADAAAKLLLQAQYGGTGAGTQSALTVTNLAGGLDDGTGDYCEMEQVLSNSISGTGYQIMSLHIRPSEKNRLDNPPREDEEIFSEFKLP